MTFDTLSAPKSSWLAKSTPHYPWAGGHPPECAIDGTDLIYSTLDGNPRHWIEIDIIEARVIQGLSVQTRVNLGNRIAGVQFRIGLEALEHTDYQVTSYDN